MEKPMWGTQAKAGYRQGGPEATSPLTGGQGVRREAESEGHEEKYRAVVDGGDPVTNRSAKGGVWSSLHYGGEGVLIHPPYQGVCGRHGTEDQHVTPGGLELFSEGTERSNPISASEVGSGAARVVGPPRGTLSVAEASGPRERQPGGLGKAVGQGGWCRQGHQISKGERVDKFHE